MKNEIYEKLMVRARELEAQFDTEWSDNHPEAWAEFDKVVNDAYDVGQITAAEYDEIVATGFFDHDLKSEY